LKHVFLVASTIVDEANIGIECGTPTDTSATQLLASGVNLRKCTTDILQYGLSTLRFVGGTFNSTKMTINNPTNVSGGAFDIDSDAILTMGGLTDSPFKLYQVASAPHPNMPYVGYESNYYQNKGLIYQNPNANNTCQGVKSTSENANYFIVTGNREKDAAINLISDAGNFGNPDNVRGWKIAKKGSEANLEISYNNTDGSGQAERGSNSIMTLNGFDNQVEFPVAANSPLPTNTVAKLVWAGDTNLYRNGPGELKTDGDVVVEGLDADKMVATDTNKKLVSIATSTTELGYLSGVTGPIQPQLDDKVTRSGDTMTGPLQMPSGSTANPTIKFTGSTNTGISAGIANQLSFSTNSNERMSISEADITMLAKLILTKVFCDQAIQSATATDGGSVTVNATTSILMLISGGNVSGYTVTFPPSPTNGQKFTILTRNTANRDIDLVNVGGTGGATVVNAVTRLNRADRLIGSRGGTSVTYIYYQPDNTWYRCDRG